MDKKDLFILLIIISIFLLTQYKALSQQPNDEFVYFYMSKLVSEGKIPYIDFFYAHPPLQLYLYAFLWRIIGFSVLFKIVPLFFGIITGLLIFLIVYGNFGKNYAFISLIFYFFNAITLFNASFESGVVIATFLMVLGYYFIEKNVWLAGTSFGFAALYRLHILIVMFSLFLLLFFEKKPKNFVLFGSFTLVFLLINGIFWGIAGDNYIQSVYKYHFKKPNESNFTRNQFFNAIKVLWLLFFFAIFNLFFELSKNIIKLGVSIIAFLIYLILTNVFFMYYFVVLIPFLSILAAIGAYRISMTNKAFFISVLLLIILDIGFNFYALFGYVLEQDQPALKMLEYIKNQDKIKLLGDSSLITYLALNSNKEIAYNEVDTNSMLYESGIKDINDLLEKAKSENILFILRVKGGIYDRIKKVRDFLNNCELLKIFKQEDTEYRVYDC